MRNVKIVLVEDPIYNDYDEISTAVIRDGISNWESISDEDYKFLKDNLWRLQNKSMMIIEQDPVPVIKRIDSIKKWIKEEKDRVEQAAAARKAEQEEKARKRLLKKAGNEIKLLEELKKKYPDAV
jgi:hypothetical protein